MTAPVAPAAVELAYARQSWTTAVHLEAALRRRCQVTLRGPGQPAPPAELPASSPVLWVESGVGWFPPPRSLRGPSAAYLIDTHRGWRWRASVASAFGTAFVAQRAAVAAFASVGVPATWLPLAAAAELCEPGPALADRPYDVAMVGHVTPGSLRAEVLAALQRCCLVAPVPGFLPPPEMMQVYRSSRVVVNVPLSGDLNMRAFEALGARSTLVTGRMDGADGVLGQLPVVVPPEAGPSAWVEAVTAAAERADQERADAGYRLVTTEHTYDQRAQVLLAALADQRPAQRSSAAVAGALAGGWARWGDVGEVWGLTRSPRRSATALAWRGLTATKGLVGSRTPSRWVHRHT